MKPENIEGGVSRMAGDRAGVDCIAEDRPAADRTVEEYTAAECTLANHTAIDRTAADRKKARRKSAVRSAVLFTVMHLAAAGILLWVRAGHDPASFLAKFTLVLTGLELVSVIPLWFSLKERFREIEGGEEDAAAQY